jgi:hypothetical protein
LGAQDGLVWSCKTTNSMRQESRLLEAGWPCGSRRSSLELSRPGSDGPGKLCPMNASMAAEGHDRSVSEAACGAVRLRTRCGRSHVCSREAGPMGEEYHLWSCSGLTLKQNFLRRTRKTIATQLDCLVSEVASWSCECSDSVGQKSRLINGSWSHGSRSAS